MEVWKPIEHYEGYYEVSDQGRVRSLDRLIQNPWHDPAVNGSWSQKPKKGGLIKLETGKKGYVRVHLRLNDGGRHRLVARLVAKAFVPNPSGLPDVNHIDLIKSNNVATNLEWITKKGNIQHAVQAGKWEHQKGSGNPMATLKDDVVLAIRERYAAGERQCDLARAFGLRRETVYKVVSGKRWSHLTRKAA